MCTVFAHQHTCRHELLVRHSACAAHFRVPARPPPTPPPPPPPPPAAVNLKVSRRRDGSGSSNSSSRDRPVCSGTVHLRLRRAAPCPSCAHAAAQTAMPADLGPEEQARRLWTLSRQYPAPDISRWRQRPRRWAKAEGRGRGSLLRVEILPEELEEPEEEWDWEESSEGRERKSTGWAVDSATCAEDWAVDDGGAGTAEGTGKGATESGHAGAMSLGRGCPGGKKNVSCETAELLDCDGHTGPSAKLRMSQWDLPSVEVLAGYPRETLDESGGSIRTCDRSSNNESLVARCENLALLDHIS